MRAEKTSHQPTPPPPQASPNGDGHGARPAGGHGHGHDEPQVAMDLPPVSRGALVVTVIATVVLFAALFVVGFLPHKKRLDQADADAAEAAGSKPVVNVTVAHPMSADPELVLPGNVRALQEADLFPRTNGYVTEVLVDIGDHVRGPRPSGKWYLPDQPGQPLARISAPEVDAELEQARATLEQAKVVVGRAINENNFATDTYSRYQGLSQTGGVTQQQLDEKRSAYNISISSLKAAKANVLAAEAAVRRSEELKRFQSIRAPFDGEVTVRNFDVGTRVSATEGGAGRAIFQVQQTDVLRVYVNVPQGYTGSVTTGQEAVVTVNRTDGPPVRKTGKVSRTAGSLDQTSRTMLVEVQVPNDDRQMRPGETGDVRFKLPRDRQPLVVPTSAFMFGAGGMRVAVVDGANRVAIRKVTLGRDFGSEAEISEGVKPGERVVTNPGERLADGVEVQVAAKKGGEPEPAKPAGGAAPQPRPATQQASAK
ncbi:MAG TPA: efflux RND transporter periplasmic adaptor subunit [Humisphaera sp.]